MISRLGCIAVGVAIFLLGGCTFNFYRDHEIIKTEPFIALDVSGPFIIKYKKSNNYRICVTGAEKKLQNLELSYLGHMVHIALDQGSEQLTIYVDAPKLSAVYLNGSITAHFLDMEQDTLTMRAAGDYTCTVSGIVNTLKIITSGSGLLDAKNLHVDTVSVEASGASSVAVSAGKILDIKAYGTAIVRYKGDPLITKEVVGSGSVVRM